MLLFYTEKITPRLKYSAKALLKQLLGLEISIITDKEDYLQSTLPKINYSKNPLQSGIYIQSANLLFEHDIFEQEFHISSTDKGEPLLYSSGKQSQLSFDPFASTFFMLTRYEEYIPFIADEHNRFPAKESLLSKKGKLHLPVVNIWANILAEKLLEFYPNLSIKKPAYRFTNTVDIDNAYAYLGKGIMRTFGGIFKDIFSLNFSELAQRTQVLMGNQKDPFETFDHVLSLQEKYGFETIYFALFSTASKYDRNLSLYSPRLQRYLKSINDFCTVGIHPSYRSNNDPKVAEEELLRLEEVLNTDVIHSRQHFIKLSFPETYRNLIDLEIEHDYSMGFAAESGFRAGICTPFTFYDLELEVETKLTVHPFPFMDGTYIYYQQTSPKDALAEILNYIEVYKQYGGEFIPLWHNRIFSEKDPLWKGWNEVYEEMIKAATT
jgi:hypothetical protein